MHNQLLRLSELARKPSRIILGLMSGTSLDGLDLALCKCSGDSLEVLQHKTVEYDDSLRSRIRAVQSRPVVDLQELCMLHTGLAHQHARMVLEALNEWETRPEDVDLIASHGQTICHLPDLEQTSTLQIVDGDHLAYKTGIMTVSDFRQKHTAAGGQGAPLAALMDEALFRHEQKNRLLLNLGGIANFTWLPAKANKQAEILTTDTGPANTLINEAMQKYFGKAYDKGGGVAARGKVHSKLLKYLLLEPFFRKEFPKTTGQEEFRLEVMEELMGGYEIELSPEDLVASLTQLTVYSISRACEQVLGDADFECYVSGGGVHNPVIMNGLKERLPNAEFRDFEELGMPGEAKEAALMAFLGNALVIGKTFQVNGNEVSLGKVSLC